MCDSVYADNRYHLHSFLWLTGEPQCCFHWYSPELTSMMRVVGVVYHSCPSLYLHACTILTRY